MESLLLNLILEWLPLRFSEQRRPSGACTHAHHGNQRKCLEGTYNIHVPALNIDGRRTAFATNCTTFMTSII